MRRGGEVEIALARSALYEALALGFRAPGPETVARLASAEGAAGLADAAEALAPALVPHVRRLAREETLAALAAAHGRLFGHTVRGAAPAYETEYGGDDLFQQPQEMADVAGFYAAFGLTLAPGRGERPDHLSCECEFLMFLARKEAVALERGDGAMLAATRRATRLFLRDHLGRFVPALAARVARADRDGFYGRLGALADAFVRHECEAAGVEPGPSALGLRAPITDRVPMACGACPAAAPGAAPADGD
jgi:DMSO reductase family type II enzyme chaperone